MSLFSSDNDVKRLKYSDDPIANVMTKKDVKKRIKSVLNKIYNIVGSTSGPFGNDVIIQDNGLSHYTTKDGYTVMNHIVFKDDMERVISDFIKKVSSKLNRTVGDGTTSAILVATKLYDALLSYSNDEKLPFRFILQYLKDISINFEKIIIENFAKKIDLDDENWCCKLNKVAYTSANNRSDIADIVTNAFKLSPYGLIDVKMGMNEKTELDTNPGYEHNRGYLHPFMAFKDKKFDCAGNVRIFMSEIPITGVDLRYIGRVLKDLCMDKDAAVVMMAPSFSEEVMNMIWQNKNNPNLKDRLKICLVDIAVNSEDAKKRFEDLRIFTGSVPYNGEVSLQELDERNHSMGLPDYAYMGTVDSVMINETNSYFIKKNLDRQVSDRAELIANEIKDIQIKEDIGDKLDRSEEIAKLRKRYANMSTSGSVIIRVGGITEQEKKNLYYLIEDAVHACRSAINYGIVPGLNYANLKSLSILTSYYYDVETNKDKLSADYDGVYDENEFKHKINLTCLLYSIYLDSAAFIITNGNPKIKKERAYELLNQMIKDNEVYDIKENDLINISDKDLKIVNSVQTDIEVLKTSISIIGLLLNSSNFICSTGYLVSE